MFFFSKSDQKDISLVRFKILKLGEMDIFYSVKDKML